MNFPTTVAMSFNRQFFPWTPEIKHLRNVIEYRMQGEFWRWTTASGGEVGQIAGTAQRSIASESTAIAGFSSFRLANIIGIFPASGATIKMSSITNL
jgi:hypothetical protein